MTILVYDSIFDNSERLNTFKNRYDLKKVTNIENLSLDDLAENILFIDFEKFENEDISFFIKSATENSVSGVLFEGKGEKLIYSDKYIISGMKDSVDGLKKGAMFFAKGESFREIYESFKSGKLENIKVVPTPKTNSKVEKEKYAFLDRDGVIIVNTGYPHIVSELIFKEDLIPLLKNLKARGFKFVVITNQSGIGRGYFKEEKYFECENAIDEWVKKFDIKIERHYFCPFHESAGVGNYKRESIFRKKMPGMVLKAAEELNIDLENSIMIGDNKSDRIQIPLLKCFIVEKEKEFADFKSFDDLLDHLEKDL